MYDKRRPTHRFRVLKIDIIAVQRLVIYALGELNCTDIYNKSRHINNYTESSRYANKHDKYFDSTLSLISIEIDFLTFVPNTLREAQ